MQIFTKNFWLTTLEAVVATFASTFAGSLAITGTPDAKNFVAAAVAGGVAAIYVFSKALGGTQALSATKTTGSK